MKASTLDSIIFNLLVTACRHKGNLLVRPWWGRLNSAFQARRRIVRTTIHERSALVNFGYTYPVTARLYPNFNNPLLELVHATYKSKQRSIRLVDVGAAIGDTVLLVDANCPGMVSEYVCVDGDAEFFEYLKKNLSHLSNVRCILHQLSRSAGLNPELVRIHVGTASAQGKVNVKTAPLDSVLDSHTVGPVDVLKIDVDGFDGEVLAGATTILKNSRPGVIFEWHPILCKQTGNSWSVAFEILRQNGYRQSAWFTKFGTFSHFESLDDISSLRAMAEFCETTTAFSDWHYDVVCLPGDNPTGLRTIADLAFARQRKSQF